MNQIVTLQPRLQIQSRSGSFTSRDKAKQMRHGPGFKKLAAMTNSGRNTEKYYESALTHWAAPERHRTWRMRTRPQSVSGYPHGSHSGGQQDLAVASRTGLTQGGPTYRHAFPFTGIGQHAEPPAGCSCPQLGAGHRQRCWRCCHTLAARWTHTEACSLCADRTPAAHSPG